MDNLSIGEVAQRSGLRASAIRYYERAGLLPPPPRVSGQRQYAPDILERLALIGFAQDAGFTIAEILILFEGFEGEATMSQRWRVLATAKVQEADELIRRAERMKTLLGIALECDCLRIEDCSRALYIDRKSQESHQAAEALRPVPRYAPG